MKLILYILLLSSVYAYPKGLDRLTIPKLKANKVPLTKVLHKIISYSRYQPLIDQNIKGTTSLNLSKVPFRKALQTISKLHGLQVSFMGKAIVVTKQESNLRSKLKGPKKESPLTNYKEKTPNLNPKIEKIKKAFAFPPRVSIKRDKNLTRSEEQELQKILEQFSPKLSKVAARPLHVKQTQLLGTTKSGSEYTAIVRYKGEERLCQIGSDLDENVQVKTISEKHLVAFDKQQNKKVLIGF